MRLAVLSDTHSNAVAFEAVIQDIKEQSPDAIVFLGDVTMRGPQPSECVELLRSLNALALVRGNYDHMFTRFPESKDWRPATFKEELKMRAFEYHISRLSAAEQSWIGNFPMQERLTIEGVNLELYHASPDSMITVTYPWAPIEDLEKLHRNDNTQIVLYGHIHHSFVRQARGRMIVNCGSVGFPFDGDNRASYAILDLNDKNVSVQLRRVSYDFDKVIRIARQNAMPDLELFEYGIRNAKYPYYHELWQQLVN